MRFTRADFEADRERLQTQIGEALDAGYAEDHPIVIVPRRRLATVERTLADPERCRALGIEGPPEDGE